MSIGRLIIWGCGELGTRVGRLWRDRGGDVIGVTQTDERHSVLATLGFFPCRLQDPVALRDDDRLLLCAPGSPAQTQALELLTPEPPPRRVVLASTVAFYGGREGAIDEQTPPGDTPRARAAAGVESTFVNWTKATGVILRFGGLYRAGRGPFARYQKAQHVPNDRLERPLTLMHYQDAARTALAALVHPQPANCYLTLTAPSPTRREFYTLAADALGLPGPCIEGEPKIPTRAFRTERLRRDLLADPLYPDWRAALSDE
jgi:nucleoside-diphosphate-sugar epimerase